MSIRLAFRPFVDAFKFEGRSTRSEVASFWLLSAVVNAFHMNADNPSLLMTIAGVISTLVWDWPWIALFVRRLHDQDRTGRWAWLNGGLIAMTVAGLWTGPAGNGPNISIDWWFFRTSRQIAWTPITIIATVVAVTVVLAIWLLFLFRGTTGTNRYGPDPRLVTDPIFVAAET